MGKVYNANGRWYFGASKWQGEDGMWHEGQKPVSYTEEEYGRISAEIRAEERSRPMSHAQASVMILLLTVIVLAGALALTWGPATSYLHQTEHQKLEQVNCNLHLNEALNC